MFKRVVSVFLCVSGMAAGSASAVDTGLVPYPAQIEVTQGSFRITPSTRIVAPDDDEIRAIATYFSARLQEVTGFELPVQVGERAGGLENVIRLHRSTGTDPILGNDGYRLLVAPRSIMLYANEAKGMFAGVQTIRQLLPPQVAGGSQAANKEFAIPCLRIKDWSRYAWRGMLLDCCRHYMTPEFVKRTIDLLAYHKMNVLHWHLTEDQGWRMEIKKYPKLTAIGAWRGQDSERYGGYYTQEQIKDIVAYAASRYVTVVPEIEMPGHSQAALAAYPELSCTGGPFEVGTRWGVYKDVYCAGNEQTFEFLENVLNEVLELFPSQFIHIGGDECPKDRWRECAKCQARIAEQGLADEHELQSYFIRRIEKFLSARGRRLIGWDEILEGGLAPGATVQSWRGMAGAIAAARAGHDVISSPTTHCYLDYPQVPAPGSPGWMGVISLKKIHSFEPTPDILTPEEARHILGAEGNMWTERAPQERVDHQVFPRLCALAEVTWSPAGRPRWPDFSRRMKTHYRRLDALGVSYFLDPPRRQAGDTVFTESTEVVLENPLGRGAIHYTLDASDPTPGSRQYTAPLRLDDSAVVTARTFLDSGRGSDAVAFRFVKQQPLDPVEVAEVLPGLWHEYYEYEDDVDRLPDFDGLAPVSAGTAPALRLGMQQREDRFALRFRGFIEVPADGLYTFYLKSDDGSRLTIGSTVVVDHDGLHGAVPRSGQVILKAGRHPLRVEFFEAGGNQHLEVHYQGPGIRTKEIPAAALTRPTKLEELPG